MSRVPVPVYDELTAEQRRVYDAIASGPRGGVRGPLAVWLQSAELADRAQALGAFCRFDTSLPRRLSELAILVTGAFWQAGYEWHAHAPMAEEAGLDHAAIEAIRSDKSPMLARSDEAAVYAFSRELLDTHQVSAETYRRVVAEIGVKGAVELVGILGYYGLVSMTIRAFEVGLPAGVPNPFADR
jgi:4-carboxymuconolactone decarboxylase